MTELQFHFDCWSILKAHKRSDVVAFHVPNGEKRDRRTASRLQACGVVPGVSDFILIVDGTVHGIELKTTKGRQDAAQIVFQADLQRAGGHYHVARTIEEFAGILNAIGACRVRLATNSLAGVGARTPGESRGNLSPKGTELTTV